MSKEVYVIYQDYGAYKGCSTPLAVMDDTKEVLQLLKNNKYLTYEILIVNDTSNISGQS